MQVAQSGHPREEDRLEVVVRVGQCCHIPGVSSSRVGRQISRLTFEISKNKKDWHAWTRPIRCPKRGCIFQDKDVFVGRDQKLHPQGATREITVETERDG